MKTCLGCEREYTPDLTDYGYCNKCELEAEDVSLTYDQARYERIEEVE